MPNEESGRAYLRQLHVLKGGHIAQEEHGCTPACQMPAGTVEYICTLHGNSVYGGEGCPSCLRVLKERPVRESVTSQ